MLRKQIEHYLLEQHLITPQDLQRCLEEQKNSTKLLEDIVVEKGFISKEQMASILAIQAGMPFIQTITEQMAQVDLLAKVPLKFLRQHSIIPVLYEGKKTILTARPYDLQPLDDLSLLLDGEIQYGVAVDTVIMDAINRYYPLETSKAMIEGLEEKEENSFEFNAESLEDRDIMEMANDAPIVKLVNHLIYQAVKEGASDIHIEPFEKELRVRYRIDGNLYQRVIPPKRYQNAIVSRIKIMSNLNIAEKRVPQDGRIQIKVADRAIDLRVSILPCNFGERVVMRLLDKSKGVKDLDSFNFSKHDSDVIDRAIARPNGIILVSGPTGSGKTSTLYAVLTKLNEPDVNIITVEDPVEYTINGISQVQVNVKAGLTFAGALRSILRQDPDICLIGEIRDTETAQIATQAALTGHLVLSTIHTNSAPATITRLIDMNIEPFLIASSLVCVISQRLVRRLCEKCKQRYTPKPEVLARLSSNGPLPSSTVFYKAVGCDDCLQMGYKGRLPIFEMMEITDELAKLIVDRVDATVIRDQALKEGMVLMVHDGVRHVIEGNTTLEEVLSVAYLE